MGIFRDLGGAAIVVGIVTACVVAAHSPTPKGAIAKEIPAKVQDVGSVPIKAIRIAPRSRLEDTPTVRGPTRAYLEYIAVIDPLVANTGRENAMIRCGLRTGPSGSTNEYIYTAPEIALLRREITADENRKAEAHFMVVAREAEREIIATGCKSFARQMVGLPPQ
ncbi:MAG: hypothetical protein V4564_14145 [Pseudomonadota bacterium]